MDLRNSFQQGDLRPVLALGMVILSLSISAQLVCDINIGPDHTICQGETVTLNGPPGYNNHLWSTGANSQNITVGASGNYWVQVSYPTGELVTNGDFNAGNTGFTTQFNYSNNLWNDGNYFIGTNAATYHPQFVGTGNGDFLMLNAGWMHGYWNIWCQTHDVCPGQTYQLTFRAASLAGQGPPDLQWFMNGVGSGVIHTAPLPQGNWQYFTTNWTVPDGVYSVDFCLKIVSGHGVGNDLGLDDISISSTIILTDDVNVNVTPLPDVDLGPNATLCQGQTLTLDAAVPGGTYLWQDGSTASSYVVNGPGNYNVTVTANNCSDSDVINVNYLPLPPVDLGPDQTLCTGETLVLDATVPGATYVWQDGSTAPTFTVTGPGTYSVNVWLNGCMGTDAITMFYQPLPNVQLGPDQTICAGGQVVFNATTPNSTYLWHDGSTGPTHTATTAGTVSVDVTVNGCTSSDQANVTVTPLPVVNLGPDHTVCPGTPVTLNATQPGATYLWQDGSTGPTFTTDQQGDYSVAVTVNGCTNSDAVTIANHTLPVVDLGADISICEGASETIGVNVPNATYLWNTGAATATIDVSNAGSYWVNVIQNGCTVSDTIAVSSIPLPVVDLGPALTICPGTTTLLDATTPGATYAWSSGANTATINAGPGDYSVDVTVNGCTTTAAITIGEHPGAQVSLGNDTTLCPGEELVLNVFQNGASYEWHDGSTGPEFTVTAAGSHSVTITDANGCTATDQINVAYANPATIDLGPDVTICAGDEWILDATLPGATYLWNTGATTPTITVDATGDHSVTVTQGNCTVSDQIIVQVVDVPVFSLGNDTTLCPGGSLDLIVDLPGTTISWSTGATDPSIQVDQAGTYSATVTNAADCSTTHSITVAIANASAIDLGPDATICEGEELLLDATLPGASYLWSTGAQSATLSIMDAGTYWVEATQGACSVSDTIVVSVNPIPTVDLGGDVTICEGDEFSLGVTWPGATYSWNTGENTPIIEIDEAGTYSLTVELNGCTATDEITVTVLSGASVDLGPDITACSSETVVLDATAPGASHLWNTGATSPMLEVGASGTYWVQVSFTGCVVSDTVVVVIEPTPVIDLGADQTLCAGETSELDATWPGATYAWNSGETSPTITVTQSGTYEVTASLGDCSATDTVTITVLDQIDVDLGPDAELCAGAELILDATVPGADHLWSTSAITPTLSVTSSGTYWAQVSIGDCVASDTIIVTINDPGTVDLGDDQDLCEGESATLDATLLGATYLWSDGVTDPIRSITTSGTFSVVATVGECSVSDEVEITFHAVPVADLGDDLEICPGASAIFDVTTPGATYLWHDGSTDPTYETSISEPVGVTVSVGSCSDDDEALVTVVDGPVAELGVNAVLCEGSTMTLDVSQPEATYLWDDGSTDAIRILDGPGTFWVDVYRNDCLASDTIVVEFFSPVLVDLGPDADLCQGSSIELTNPIPGANVLWSTGSTANSITVSDAGTYWIDVHLGGCNAQDTIIVNTIEVAQADLGEDVTLCAGESLVLEIDPAGALVTWSTGETNSSIVVSEAGIYSVTLEMDGCSATDAVEVNVMEMITEIDLGENLTICPGQFIQLDASLPVPASFSWNNGGQNANQTIDSPGEYSVHATGNCVDAYATITITEGDCGPAVYIPNSFTPNNDGLNDNFKVSIDGELANFRLEIYDRWGEAIFNSTSPDEGWDGQVNGQFAPDGVYVWKVSYRALINGRAGREELLGHVTLLR